MKTKKMIAEILDPVNCRHYKRGQKFVLESVKPAGLCDIAFANLQKDARKFLLSSDLPSVGDDSFLTLCPHEDGATWQLTLQENKETSPA